MVRILATPSKAVQWSGGLRWMGHFRVKQYIDGAHASDEFAGDLFCWNQKFDLENLGQRHVVEKR